MGRKSYLEFSDADFRYAIAVFELGFYDPCGRFCQQSVEKRLKHFIEYKGYPEDVYLFSIHDLKKLYKQVCKLANVEPDKITISDLTDLVDYYFKTNYPKKDNIELTKEMAEEAIETMKKMNGWVDELLRKD